MKFNGDAAKISQRAKAIKLFLLDVDGILTDGRLFYSEKGEETKVFNTLDGHGIKMLQSTGVEVGVISGRNCAALTRRLTDLGIKLQFLGREEKLAAFVEIQASRNLTVSEIAFAGDDWPDLPVMNSCGLSFTVPNAHAEVRRAAALESEACGGQGAVREMCDFLLQASGQYHEILERYATNTSVTIT